MEQHNHYEWSGTADKVTMYNNGAPLYTIERPLDNPLIEPDFFLTLAEHQWQLLQVGIELLPCPFCASRCIQLCRAHTIPVYTAMCWNCEGRSATAFWAWSEDEDPFTEQTELNGKTLAAGKWNRRPKAATSCTES